MLFTSFTTATAQSIQVTETLIEDLQQQLDTARQQLAQLQQEQQAQQTAKSAALTAIEMVQKARRMVAIAYGEDAVKEFNAALLEDQQPYSELPAGDNDTKEQPSPEPAPTTPLVVDEAIEVTATEVKEQPKEEVSESPAETDFNHLTWQQLQKLASKHNISPRGKKRPEIESLLKNLGVTDTDTDINSAA